MEIVIHVIYILMFVVIGCMLGTYFASAKRRRKVRQEMYKNRSCEVCVNRSTMNCPNSSLCWSTTDKPYFIPKEEDKEK